MPAYCEVALPVPLDHTFTYGVRLGQSAAARGARDCALPQREADRRGDGASTPRLRRMSRCGISKPCSTRSRCSASICWNWRSGPRSTTWRRWARCCAPCCRSRPRCAARSTTGITDLGRDVLAGSHRRRSEGRRESPSRARAAAEALAEEPGHGAPRAGAAGLGRAGESLHAAHGHGGIAAAAGRHGAQEVDCARDRGRRARRAPHGALCRAGSRGAAALADRKAAGDSGRACGLRRRTAAGRTAPPRSALVDSANAGAARAGAHRGAAGSVSPGRADAHSRAVQPERSANRCAGHASPARSGHSIRSCFMA